MHVLQHSILTLMYKTLTRFMTKVKRLLDFVPIIWKSYDFDYRYALDLFHYQLTRTADLLESPKASHLYAKQDARRLRTILELMKKVYDEEYRMEYYDTLESIYGKNTMIWEDREDGTYLYKGLQWEGVNTPEEQKGVDELYNTLREKSEKKHQKAKQLLWKMVEHNLENFWD
jgi:hypothetical protein